MPVCVHTRFVCLSVCLSVTINYYGGHNCKRQPGGVNWGPKRLSPSNGSHRPCIVRMCSSPQNDGHVALGYSICNAYGQSAARLPPQARDSLLFATVKSFTPFQTSMTTTRASSTSRPLQCRCTRFPARQLPRSSKDVTFMLSPTRLFKHLP